MPPDSDLGTIWLRYPPQDVCSVRTGKQRSCTGKFGPRKTRSERKMQTGQCPLPPCCGLRAANCPPVRPGLTPCCGYAVHRARTTCTSSRGRATLIERCAGDWPATVSGLGNRNRIRRWSGRSSICDRRPIWTTGLRRPLMGRWIGQPAELSRLIVAVHQVPDLAAAEQLLREAAEQAPGE
jgi:hypothetical protein